ncbi:MAG: cytochrome P450 [Flavobacteriia bacterium]|nr:cytochrome P450 [Flavobacteriia bacterium]
MSYEKIKKTGPKGLPFIGNLHQIKFDKLHQYIENWVDQYGEIYQLKLGPSKFTVITKPDIIQAILKARPDDFLRLQKMDKVLRAEGVHGVFNAEGEEWKIHRKIVAKGLDVKHQQQFFPSIVKTLERFYNKMENVASRNEEYCIQNDLLRFTVDVTTSLVFGQEMNTLEQEGGIIQEHMEKLFPVIFKRINEPIPFHKIYRSKKDKDFDIAVHEIDKLIDQFIAVGRERLELNPILKLNPDNLLEAIIVAAEEEHLFSDKEIKGNLLTLLMAGEDTTAHSMAWAILLLSQRPDIQDKLNEEADAILGTDSFLNTYEKHSELSYTEAVINESMRMKPVAPLLLIEASKDVTVKELQFKKGAKIILNSRKGANEDVNFSSSKDFNPERWLRKTDHGCPMHNLDAYIPFGSGPRFCPGKNLALLEMKLILSTISKHYRIELMTPFDEVHEIMAFTMMASDYKIKLVKRG